LIDRAALEDSLRRYKLRKINDGFEGSGRQNPS
jgi:hypothetical protein